MSSSSPLTTADCTNNQPLQLSFPLHCNRVLTFNDYVSLFIMTAWIFFSYAPGLLLFSCRFASSRLHKFTAYQDSKKNAENNDSVSSKDDQKNSSRYVSRMHVAEADGGERN